MRLLRSICRVGRSHLPSIQRLVAVTVLVGVDTATAAAAADSVVVGLGGGSTTANAMVGGVDAEGADDGTTTASSSPRATAGGGNGGSGGGDDDDETRAQQAAAGKRGEGAGGAENFVRYPRGLFRYELIRDIDATTTSGGVVAGGSSGTHGSDGGNGSGGATTTTTTTGTSAAGSGSGSATATAVAAGSRQPISNSSSWHNQPQRRPLSGGTATRNVRSADGTRGIRVRLKRLVEGPSIGSQLRRQRERDLGETPVSSGEGVLFEAVQEGSGSESRTVIRVLSR